MAKDNRRSQRGVKVDESIKPKKKAAKQDAAPASTSRPRDASSSRRSSRGTLSSDQTKENLTSTRKSKRLEKQKPSATPPTKKEKSERSQKQTTASPLKRYDRRRKHTSLGSSGSKKVVEEPASVNTKSKKEKVGRSLKQRVIVASEDNSKGNHGRKRKRAATRVNKALSKRQRIKTEAGDDNDKESQDKSSVANSSSNSDVEMKLKRLDKLHQSDNSKNECSGSKSGKDEDDGGDECSDRSGDESTMKAITTDSGLSNFGVEEVNDDTEVGVEGVNDDTEVGVEEVNDDIEVGVEEVPHHVDLEQVGNGSCPSRKSLDGKSTESGTDALNSDTSSSYNRQTSTSKTDPDTCKNIKDHPVSDKSPSSRCKKHGHDETCLGCSKKQRENRSPGKQQELNCCDTISNSDLRDTSSSKDRTTCEAAALAESVEKDNGVSRTGTSICRACKLGGELRYCDAAGCNRGYHLSCLDPPVNNVPLGNWRCLHCVKNIKSCVRVIESIWDTREVEVSDAEGLQKQKQKQHFVKYKDLAHIHNQWVPETELLFEAPLRVENFSKNGLLLLSNTSSSFQMKWTEEWTVPQQLLKKRLLLSFKPLYETLQNSGKVLNYHYEWLVKWQDLDYEQATWESENITVLDSPEGWNLIREYENHHGNAKIPSSSDDKIKELSFRLPTVPAGNLAGMDNIHLSYVKNLHDAWNKEKNNLVFDDQERTMRIVLFIFSLMGVTHPFLLITTSNSLSQWEATFSRIALCNGFIVAVEEGQRGSRLLEVETEGGKLVFQVLLYHVDAFVKDSNVLKAIEWEGVIVDECQSSEISAHFSQVKSLSTNKRLLVCSGPLVVSMASYPDVLSLLDCDGPWPNLSKFIAYECKASSSKFVEFWVPVQISNLQLEQYCSLILSNAMALSSCSKSDMFGALHDILVSNRKCCDHPYIVDQGLQGVLTKGLEPVKFLDVGIQASGKLQFLDLILPEMRKRQLRVLILFQPLSGSGKDSTSIGDILDDFVRQRFGEDSYERVDGGIIPSKKQAALNNFNNKDMGRFIFLLEYRACLPSIKLSSVDTVVIFDSDWNPANDIRALQKIAIDSQSEQIMIFRLYTSWTLEEKILILAEHNITIDSKLQNVSRSTSDALLTWGATYLFNKLAEFHGTSSRNISSEEHLRNEVMEEFLNLVSHKGENTDTSKSIITRVQQSCGTYSKNIQLPSELIIQLPNGEQPSSFWKNLLMGRDPCWKFLPRSNPRQRKRPQYCEESPRKLNTGNDDVGRKRKKTASVTEPVASASAAEGEIAGACNDDVGRKRKKTANVTEPVASASAAEEGEIAGACKGVSSVPSHDGSQSSPANSVWYNADGDETSLLSLLRLNISKLCEVLSLSEDVKIMVERFLEYVMENFHVNKESDNTLQAFLISLCWIGSELVKHELDRRQSVALAQKYLSFICNEEEAKSLCLKLEPAREMFLCHLEKQKRREMSFNPQDVKVEDDEMVYSGSDHGDQDSSKRTPTLSRNQIQVECHDRAVSSDIVTSPNVTESGSIPAETVVSHTDLSSASVSVNALSFKLASASIEDQPEGVGGSENHVEVAGANGNEPTSPCTSVKQVDDVAISSARILERNHEGVVGNHLVKQVDSVRMEVLVADCNEEIARVPDGSRCGEDRNDVILNDVEGNLGSVGQTDAASKSLSAAVSKEKLPEASGQPVPTNLESRNDSIQDDEVQGHPSSSTEINNPISINAGIDGLINSEDSSCVSLSASLPAVENQSNTPPACEVVPAITSGGQTTLSAAIPTEPEAHNPSTILEAPPQVSSQAATPLGPNLLNMQVGYDNLNVGVSRTPNRSSFSSDPLQAEVEKLREVKDNVISFHEANKLKLKSDYEKEFAEMVTHLNLKYDIKRQDEEAAFQSKVKEVDTNLNRMVMNKVLAEAFKFKCQDVGPSDLMGRQGGGQHLHQFPARPSLRPSSGVASSSASQSSGSQQATRLQPPLQVVHHSANLFSNTPTRPSSTSNPSNMPSRSPANPTPTNMPIRSQANPTLTSMPIRSPANNTPTSMPIRSPANRTPTSMPIRSPANTTPTTMPGRAPPNINPSTRPSRPPPPPNITPSFRPSRPQPPPASSSVRIPRVGGEIRAPAPHIRPFRPSTSVAPHDLASHRAMTSRHASSSLPPSSATTFSQASSRMSSQTPPPVPPNHNGHLTQNSPSSLPAASPSPDQASSQPAASVAVAPPASIEGSMHVDAAVPSSLPPMPSISISQTGLYGYSAGSGGKGESGIVLPSADILSMPALGLLMDIDTQAAAGFNHQANMEVSKENGGGDEVVCLSDDD